MSGGRGGRWLAWQEEEGADCASYDEYYQIFRSIFKLHPTTDIYFVPGNHDIGLGPPGTFSPFARRRFQEHFGDLNAVVSVANHSLILLDSIGLIEEDRRRYAAEIQYGEWSGIAGGVIEFVQGLGKGIAVWVGPEY